MGFIRLVTMIIFGVPWNSVDRVIATKVADIACLPCSASQVLKVAPRMDHHVLPGHLPIRHAQLWRIAVIIWIVIIVLFKISVRGVLQRTLVLRCPRFLPWTVAVLCSSRLAPAISFLTTLLLAT